MSNCKHYCPNWKYEIDATMLELIMCQCGLAAYERALEEVNKQKGLI